ncbi:MAG: hypothetical protein IID51_01155 [Proteobacteria bacterium]|nr:hypothetical protein [Pseudomonadota bacterium]
MMQRIGAHKIGGALYVVWGLLHLFAGFQIYKLSGGISDPALAARMAQAGLNLAIIASATIAIAARLNWNNDRFGYWLNLGLVSLADIGFIVLLLLPGYFPLGPGLVGPALWILAALFSTIGLKRAGNT